MSYKSLHLFLLLIIFTQTIPVVYGQTQDSTPETDTMFQVSFLPGLSNTDTRSSSTISFNILGGYNGSFHGFEFGSLFNGNRYNVSGLQISGVANINESRSDGAIFGGTFNYSRDFSGFMSSGAINFIQNDVDGVLMAGGINFMEQQSGGVMLAGGMNFTKDEARGVAISPFNFTSRQAGVQIGVMNIAENQQGTQIGIINVANEGFEGESIGLLSFVGDGRFNMDVWGSETGFLNLGFRVGTQSIYNVASIGYNTLYGDHLWQVGLGIGYYHSLRDGNGLETDLTSYHINHDGKWTTETSTHIQWRFHYSHALSDHIKIFTGPGLNLLIYDEDLPNSIVPYTLTDQASGSTRIDSWAGWSLGFQFF